MSMDVPFPHFAKATTFFTDRLVNYLSFFFFFFFFFPQPQFIFLTYQTKLSTGLLFSFHFFPYQYYFEFVSDWPIIIICLVGWGCRIHWLLLCRELRFLPMSPGYDTKQSDGEVPVMLELWEMWSTPSLLLLPAPLWPRVVAHNRVLSMGQIELKCVLMLNWIVWNRTVLTFNWV